MKQTVSIKQWAGGRSPDDTRGPMGSFAYDRQVNFRSSPSVLQLNPQLFEDSGGVVTDLIMDMVLAPSGDIYAIGDTGNFYLKKASDGTWELLTNFGEASGGSIIYRSDMDALLIPLQTKVAQYSPVAGTPTEAQLYVNKYGPSASTDSAASSSGGAQTYTPTTSMTENATALRSFTPDIEPLHSIKVKIITKGTGDWTLTTHDDANNNLGSVTIANANLIANALNEFVLSTPIRMLVKPNARTYHFHLTSTVADGTVACSTASDLSTADFEMWARRFVTTHNGLHVTVQFLQYTLYGNERYLAVHEPLEDTATNAEWKRHRLTFPSGLEVCGLALYQTWAAIAAERQNSNGALDFQHGVIFLWNGTDTTYENAINIPEGSPRSLFSYEGQLYWHADGSWYRLIGQQPDRIRRFPSVTEEFSGVYPEMTINPNMMTVRRGVLLSGFPTSTNNTTVEHGVYSLGSLDHTYTESFGFEQVISTSSRFHSPSNNLKVGCVKNFGDEFYVSWRDDSNNPNHYGIDVISPLSQAAGDGRYEALWFDDSLPEKSKDWLRMKVVCAALPDGATVTPIWRHIRDGAWNNENGSQGQLTAGKTQVVIPIEKKSTECQLGVIIAGGGSNVKVRTIALQFDDLTLSRRKYVEQEDLEALEPA